MSLFNKIVQFLGFNSTQAYCQQCGKNLTHTGGYITPSKKVYCQDNSTHSCINDALRTGNEKRPGYLYATTETLQQAIQNETLRHYGPLEKKVN